MTKPKRGKFIVIEGTDGSGKTTQLHKLREYLELKGVTVKTLDFPQYTKFWGRLVGRFLNGDFGELESVDPYLVSPIYLLDQAAMNTDIRIWLDKGYWVLSNRYVTSSMAHQTAKFWTSKEKSRYLRWITNAAYKHMHFVKEDLVIVLWVDPAKARELAFGSRERKKKYAKRRDIAEEHKEHTHRAAQVYKYLCHKIRHWKLIECMKGSEMMGIEEIHGKIIKLLE